MLQPIWQVNIKMSGWAQTEKWIMVSLATRLLWQYNVMWQALLFFFVGPVPPALIKHLKAQKL